VPGQWLLLSFTIPSQPTAPRLYIWRKLKRLGAVLLHNAVWVLPANPRTREQFQWLAAEIEELGGEALVWDALPGMVGRDDGLRQQFTAQSEAAYQAILKALDRGAALDTLAQQYQQAQLSDYFQAPLGSRVREALMAARGGQSNEMGYVGKRRRGSHGLRVADQALHRSQGRVRVRARRRKGLAQKR
jgi:hypothetical protein